MERKYNFFLKQGTTYANFDNCLVAKKGEVIILKNVSVYWRSENVPKDEQITLTKKDGSQVNVLFQKGYWSFESISERMGEESIYSSQTSITTRVAFTE